MNLHVSFYRYIKRVMYLFTFLIFFAGFAQCPQSIVFQASSGAVATTTINGNGYKLGNAILTLSNTSIVSFTNTIENGHQSAYGVEIAHSGAADSFTDRVETQLSFSQPVYSLSFNLNDLDAGDRVRIQAFDQNNSAITLATGNFAVGSAVTSGTAPNWEFSSGSSNIASSDSNTTARVAVNFNNKSVSRIVLQYYDVNSNGSYTIANLTGQVLCANPDSFSNVKGNFITPTVISNDFHLASAATTSNVSASNVGIWPSGITMNSNGTVSVANTVSAGVYTLTYQICSTSTTGNCSSSTISLTILEDTDGDGIADINDQDDDNDGILDTDEGFCENTSVYTLNMTNTLSSASGSFNANGATFNLVYTLTSGNAVAGLGTTFNVPFTYSDFNNTATSVNHTWEGFNASSTVLSLRPNTGSLYTSLPANNTTNETVTGAGSSPDQRFRFWLSTGAIDQLGTFTTTIGNLPAISGQLSSLQSFTDPLLSAYSTFNYSVAGTTATDGYYANLNAQINVNGVNSPNTLPYNVPFGSTNLWNYTAFDGPVAGNATNVGNRGLVSILQNTITICNHRDTDGDGIPNYLDLDSDGDGCSDAREGSANLTVFSTSSMPGGNSGTGYNGLSSSPITQNLGNAVDNNSASSTYGVPTIAGTGQAIGQSQNSFKNDCQDIDADGIADWEDVDDDNDGILDITECTTAYNDFVTAFGAGATTDIVPSDFGLAMNAKNQNVTRDLSAKFGYPANSGAVIVSITNASVHPSANVWWTKNGELPSIWKVTGTVSAFLGMGYDPQYYANDSKTFHIYDNADVIPVTVPGLANQTPVAGQWSVTDTQSQKTLRNLDTNSGTLESGNWRYINKNFGPKSLGFSTTVASADPNYSVTMLLECDTDKDGIPNRLDLDSDADNCSDALEAGADILSSQLVTAAGTLTGGSTSVNQNLCALTTCVSTTGTNIGLPQFSTLPIGYSNTTGQAIGSSQNVLVSSCVCYEDPTLVVGQTYPVKHGITVLGRSGKISTGTGNTASDWPMIRNSAYTALESKTKGFVITRMTSDPLQAAAANHLNKITNPVTGMMVFDVFADGGKGCLKIYTGSGAGEGWKCFNSQTCP